MGGFSGDGKTCEDTNECSEDTHNCHENAMCINTKGNFTCKCLNGFQGNGLDCQADGPKTVWEWLQDLTFDDNQNGECNGVQFFPQCSISQFYNRLFHCNKDFYRGYPYRGYYDSGYQNQMNGYNYQGFPYNRYTEQCMDNVDQWITCMQTELKYCMPSNCPSVVTSPKGEKEFKPIIKRIMGAKTINDLYRTLDETIADIIVTL